MSRFRIVLCAGFALAWAPACGKPEAASGGPAVVAGVTVGTVVELAGTVTATRAGQARELKAGSEVSGDDTIATGDGARVAIELAHNGARWSLGANKSGVVAQSVAWALPKATGPAGTVEGDLSAGGRHMEKSAIETAESTKADIGAVPPAVQPPVTPPITATTTTPSDPKPIPPQIEAAKQDKEKGKSDSKIPARGTTPEHRRAEPPTVQPPPKTIVKDLETTPNFKSPAPGGASDASDPADLAAAAQAAKPKLEAALRECAVAGTPVHVKVTCAAGTCTLVPDASLDAAVTKCIGKALAKLHVDKLSGGYTLSLMLTR